MSDSLPFKDATHVSIDNVYLTSSDGTRVYNIRDYIFSLSIVEDIFSPFITCEINIVDYGKLASAFPLVGEEYITITFSSSNQSETSYQFVVYRQSYGGIAENNKFQTYTLFGITAERLVDRGISVSKSFRGSYSQIVSQIFSTHFSNLGKPLYTEPSKGLAKFVSPSVSPLSAIELCRKRSFSTDEPFTPYVFFQNQQSYNFCSLNFLFNQALKNPKSQVVHLYSNLLASPEKNSRDNSFLNNTVVNQNTKNDIVSLEIIDKYNTLDKFDTQTFKSSTSYFDLTTKALLTHTFNLNEKKNKYQLGNPGEFNTSSFMDSVKDYPQTIFVATDIGFEGDGHSKDYYPLAISSLSAYRELLLQQRINVNLYGDSDIKAGDSIFLGLNNVEGKEDKTLAGNHLISSVKHVITFDTQPRYVVSLECIKGSYLTSIGSMING